MAIRQREKQMIQESMFSSTNLKTPVLNSPTNHMSGNPSGLWNRIDIFYFNANLFFEVQ